MARLIVRKLNMALVRALKERAGRQGRSAEAEHREILREALSVGSSMDLKQVLLEMPEVGEDADFARIQDCP